MSARSTILANRSRTSWLVPIAAVLLLAIIAGMRLWGSDSKSGPKLTQPEWVRVVVDPELKSGSEFTVFYEAKSPVPPEQLMPGMALTLWRGSKAINTLMDQEPRIQPATGASIPSDVDLVGPGPITLLLPRLEPGRYTLCGYIGRQDRQYADEEPFCVAVKVAR